MAQTQRKTYVCIFGTVIVGGKTGSKRRGCGRRRHCENDKKRHPPKHGQGTRTYCRQTHIFCYRPICALCLCDVYFWLPFFGRIVKGKIIDIGEFMKKVKIVRYLEITNGFS